MRRTFGFAVVVVVVTACLALAGHHAWNALDTHWAWKRADLDRNAMNLASYRGAETGDDLGGGVEDGLVVAAGGRTERGHPGDAFVVVRYEDGVSSWNDEVKQVCYRFTIPDGSDIAFEETDCPV